MGARTGVQYLELVNKKKWTKKDNAKLDAEMYLYLSASLLLSCLLVKLSKLSGSELDSAHEIQPSSTNKQEKGNGNRLCVSPLIAAR